MLEIIFISSAVVVGVLVLLLLPRLVPANDRLRQTIKIVFLILYILVILYETLLTRSITRHFKYQLSLFWSYRQSFSFCPDASGLGLYIADSALLKQIILNILLYIPFGYLLPAARPRLAKLPGAPSRLRVLNALKNFPWMVIVTGAVLSVGIEFTQLFFRLGLFELDDIFNNTVGCLLGVILYQLLLRPRVKKTGRA